MATISPEEFWLLVVYAVIGPTALLILMFIWFYGRAGERVFKDQVALIENLQSDITRSATPRRPSVRDVGVSEAISYLVFGRWGTSFYDAASSEDHDSVWEYRQFTQAAADDLVTIWGKLGESRPYEPIEHTFWYDNDIEWFGLLKDKPFTEPRNTKDKNQKQYIRLMTCRGDAEWLLKNQPKEVLRAKSIALQSCIGKH